MHPNHVQSGVGAYPSLQPHPCSAANLGNLYGPWTGSENALGTHSPWLSWNATLIARLIQGSCFGFVSLHGTWQHFAVQKILLCKR